VKAGFANGVCPLSSGGTWTVSLNTMGHTAVHAPHGICQGSKPDCPHIEFIRRTLHTATMHQNGLSLRNVREVTEGENDVLLTPLIHLATSTLLTVACDLAAGCQSGRRCKYLHGNRIRVAQDYISQHGRKIYGCGASSAVATRLHDCAVYSRTAG